MEETTLQLGEMIENGFIVFDFDYPVYSTSFKAIFERDFIDHFYYDEIGQETPSRFKHRLKTKLNLIMPYWNKIIMADELEQRILDNYDVTETFTRDVTNTSNSSNTNNLTNNSTDKNLSSDTPVTKVDFDNIDYFSNIEKNIGNSTSNSSGTNTTTGDNKETWTRKMSGNIGVQTDSDAVVKFWQSLRQIEVEIFNQCDDLFMEVY